VLEAIGAGEKHQSEMADDYSHLAAETLDVWLWALDDGGGYWWCSKCEERHVLDD
jgi:hypothetical protein